MTDISKRIQIILCDFPKGFNTINNSLNQNSNDSKIIYIFVLHCLILYSRSHPTAPENTRLGNSNQPKQQQQPQQKTATATAPTATRLRQPQRQQAPTETVTSTATIKISTQGCRLLRELLGHAQFLCLTAGRLPFCVCFCLFVVCLLCAVCP